MIRFGTLGTANITPRALINPCMDEPKAMVRVIGARSVDNARGFAKYHHIKHVVANYDEVINHPSCNAIYNPLPITAHKEWSIKALRAGKHVLCEKSFSSNAAEAAEMAAVASETGLVLMDAFHYRYHPLFIRAREIYASGMLGKIEQISAIFSVEGTPPADDIRMNYATAGGVTMDIGCYPISWVRHLTADEPIEVTAFAEVGPQDVDLFLQASMVFPNDIEVTATGDMRPDGKFKAEIEVIGSEGSLKVLNPLSPQSGNLLLLTRNGETSSETFERRPTYSYQLDAFIAAIEEGQPLLTGPDDAVKQMQVIDRCYEAAGLPIRGL